MSNEVLIVRPEDRSSKFSVIGVDITVLATQEVASGQEMTLQKGAEGMGPPPHSHAWAESFYVLKGAVAFSCGNQTVVCAEGTLVHVPPETVHAFSFTAGGGEMLEITHKGHAVEAFRAVAEQLPKGPPDIAKAVKVFGDNGVKIKRGESVES